MPTFLDGPAHGESLTLHRAPALLRIAQNGPNFRPLDNFADEPEYTELLYVYQIVGKPSEQPEQAAIATYRFIPDQPKETQIFETHAWRGWAAAHWKHE